MKIVQKLGSHYFRKVFQICCLQPGTFPLKISDKKLSLSGPIQLHFGTSILGQRLSFGHKHCHVSPLDSSCEYELGTRRHGGQRCMPLERKDDESCTTVREVMLVIPSNNLPKHTVNQKHEIHFPLRSN